MGKVGKASNAPGFQRVAAERQKWQELKEQHLTYPWFVKELEDAVKAYEKTTCETSPGKIGEATANLWVGQEKKHTYVSMNAEERLYHRTYYVGNGMKDIDDYRDVIQVPSWGLESRMVLEDLLSKRKRAVVYELYKQEKEQNHMGNEDNKPRTASQKR